MPELPEIETVKLQLQKYLVGEEITRVIQLHPKSVHGKKELVMGKKIIGIKRLGKMLVLDLTGNVHIAIHFKMSGQLILVRSVKHQAESRKEETKNRIVGGHPSQDWIGKLPSSHTRAIFHFKNGDVMYFNDQRLFGWVKIVTHEELQQMKFLQQLGPEPWDITDQEFYALVHKRKKAIKLVIMDQSIISGVGNIYANDALWEAKIHPQTPAHTLRMQQVSALRKGLIKVLKEGIAFGGATASDAKYIDLDGLGGHYQEHFRVYDRDGNACLRCKTKIKKITLGGRGTYFCPRCQKEG